MTPGSDRPVPTGRAVIATPEWEAIAPPERAFVAPLIALTGVTGVIDAASFLGMGRIFTANMTGNVVFLGFALAGAPEMSVARCTTALIGFIVGAMLGGRLAVTMRAAPH